MTEWPVMHISTMLFFCSLLRNNVVLTVQGKEVSRGGSTYHCHLLTSYLQNRAGLPTAGAIVHLAVDWIG